MSRPRMMQAAGRPAAGGGSSLDDLVAVLADEAAALRCLVPLLERQQVALLRAEAGAVLELARHQEEVLRSLVVLDGERQALLARLGAALGVDPRRLTLSGLLERAPHVPPGLTSLRAELRELLERLGPLNQRNGVLLERSLGYVERLLAQLLSALGPARVPTYVASGRTSLGPAGPRLVDREA